MTPTIKNLATEAQVSLLSNFKGIFTRSKLARKGFSDVAISRAISRSLVKESAGFIRCEEGQGRRARSRAYTLALTENEERKPGSNVLKVDGDKVSKLQVISDEGEEYEVIDPENPSSGTTKVRKDEVVASPDDDEDGEA